MQINDNPLILATTQQLVAGFVIRNSDGAIEKDLETIEKVQRKFEHLRLFLHRNELVTIPIINDYGELIDIPLRKSDLSEDGLLLLRKKLAAWLSSKASDANPPKMQMLELALAKIRLS